MSKKISGGQIAGGNSKFKREENDFYATDPNTLRDFLNEFLKDNVFNGTILEPACGQGHLSKVLEEEFPELKVISSDLIDRGYGETGVDFLTADYNEKIDVVITNPPYSIAQEFIEKGLEVSDRLVIMLCKLQFLEGAKRQMFFKNTPLKYVYVHSKRQNPQRGGEPLSPEGKKWSSTICFAWFVWDKTYSGEPIIRWI